MPRPAWIDEVTKAPKSIPAAATRPRPLLWDARHEPIRDRGGWTARRGELIRDWKKFLGEIPRDPRATSFSVLEEDRVDGVVRSLIRYESEPGLPVEAYLLRPEAPGKNRPGAVVLHSTADITIRQPAGLEGPEDKFIGLHLAKRGFVTICPRCYLWQYGEPGKIATAVDWLKKRRPDVKGMAKMLHDAIRAVDLLVAMPDVDPRRVGSIGHSLGAKEVLYLSAFDERVRATVSSEGGVGMGYSNWDAPWYLGATVKQEGFPLDHGQVLALSAPRAMLILGGDSADGDVSWPYVEAAQPVYELTGAADAVGLFNHKQGHAFPKIAQDRSYEWLEWFLRA